MQIKKMIKKVLPRFLVKKIGEYRLKELQRQYAGVPLEKIFERVYTGRKWGQELDYNSGDGSHNPLIVEPYILAVTDFIKSNFDVPPNVVDLGCGDFSVGSKIRSACAKYVACDIVPSLITRNRQHYSDSNVEFQSIDIVNDNLPDGDIVFVRQVFQHLSNAQIQKILAKLGRYKYLVLTEHLPKSDFIPNIDISPGPHIRLGIQSGVILTSPPFNFNPIHSRELITLDDGFGTGVIRTEAYQIK